MRQEQVNLMQNIEGLFSKALKNADKLGMLFGFMSDPVANGRGLSGAAPFIIDRISNWKIPNPEHIISAFKDPGNPYSDGLKNALMLYLAGEGLDFLGQSKYAKPAKDASIGLLKGLGLAAILLLPATNPHGNINSGGNSGGNSRSWGYTT